MSSGVRSSISERTQKNYEGNVAKLREFIKGASWDNDTLTNTTQQHFSKSPCGLALDLAKSIQSLPRMS